MEKLFLKISQYSQENTSAILRILQYCEIFKNTYFEKYPQRLLLNLQSTSTISQWITQMFEETSVKHM